MNLHRMLVARAAAGTPLRVGLIGAGKFGAMYLAQAKHTPGIHVTGIADVAPERARAALVRTGWAAEGFAARSFADAARTGGTFVTDDALALIAAPEVAIVIDATGNPAAGITHVLACCSMRKHVVMVNVEADALVGPLLARRAREAGIVYSLAYGDQPALICELVDWARTSGFEVTAAGRGHKWLPHYAQSTPETVWKYWGLNEEQAKRGGLNPKMFNSFLDGSKPAIESTAVANATGLTPAPDGLAFPPCSVEDLPFVMRPASEGGQLHHKGQVEVASSLERDGRAIPYEIRKGVWVVFEAATEYQKNCFEEYMLCTDPSGRYSVMYKRWHLIGLEVGMSVASIGLRKEPTGCPIGFHADVIATAKRDLKPGEMLDGEGGYTVYGKLFPAEKSTGLGSLPLGLAHNVKLLKPIKAGQSLTYADVAMDESLTAVKLRREMEQAFAPAASKIAAQ
jgi:predicted homoserine dehydrogenase-like protein